MSFVEGGTKCLSGITNVRCQGFTTTQEIAIYIPIAAEVVLLPFLVYRAWSRPVATLLFLSLEIASGIAVSTWDLAINLSPTKMGSYQQQDVALGIISAVPLLFLLLTTMSIYLSLLRPALPHAFRSTISTVLFAVLVLPLVPIGFIGSMLGNVLLMVYRINRRNGTVSIGFASSAEEWTNTVLGAAGAISTFLLLVTSLTQFVLFHPPSRYSFSQIHLHSQSIATLSILGIGLFLAAGEVIVTLAPASFVLIIARQCVRTVSRGFLVLAFWTIYANTSTDAAPWQSIDNNNTSSVPSFVHGHAPSKGVSKLVIGGPMVETFQKMTTDKTRQFHAGRPIDGTPEIVVKPAERVIFRMPPRRAPALSFTSSLFTNTSLAALAQGRDPMSSPARFDRRGSRGLTGRPKKNVGSIYNPSRISVQPEHLAQWPLPLLGTGTTMPPSAFFGRKGSLRDASTAAMVTRSSSFSRPSPTNGRGSVVTPSSVSSDNHLDWPLPPPRAITHRQSLHPNDYAQNAVSPFDPIDARASTSRRKSDIPAMWMSNEGLSRGISIRDTPRGVRAEVPISSSVARTNSGRRKPIPRYEVYEDGPSKPPRPPKRLHAAQKSLEVELVLSDATQSSTTGSSPSFSTTPVDMRPERTVRRETNPACAIAGSDAQDGRFDDASTPSPGLRRTPPSPIPLESPDSPMSAYTDNDPTRSLFFSTPLHSPTDSNPLSSPRKSAYSSRRSVLSTVVEGQAVGGGRRRSSAEMKSVMASLYRITRDAGIRADPGRLGIRNSEIGGLRGSTQSGVSKESEHSMEELIEEPKRKFRGGVI